MPRRSLAKYQSMRDFEKTPEPSGAEDSKPGEAPRFVIQEHHATALHWDLRLEHEGVMASWALPKGLPKDPKVNHLAVQTEDHPMEYATFQGDIPKGEYGGGHMSIWDSGTYEVEKFRDVEVMITLHGEKAEGKYVLFRTEGKNWMIHRMSPPVDPTAEPMPKGLVPMLATLGQGIPAKGDWRYEIKWDGVRALFYSEAGRIRLESRNRNEISFQFPELRALGLELANYEIVLDGEIVAFDDKGRPSFLAIQPRLGVGKESQVRKLREQIPVTYVIFDLLFLNGHSTMAMPYHQRRTLLEQLEINGDHWRTSPAHEDGQVLYEVTRAQGLEGIIAKKADSIYEPGRRSLHWLKIKHMQQQYFLIAGWTPGTGAREGEIGALLAAYWDEDGKLQYAGRVGTGFTVAESAKLLGLLRKLDITKDPFTKGEPRPKESTFVEPKLVFEAEFLEWTNVGVLRHPSYKGLRPDVPPESVRREYPVSVE